VFLQNSLLTKGLVRYFICDHLRSHRLQIFVLACQVQSSQSNQVYVPILQVDALSEVLVKDGHGQEVGSLIAAEDSGNFNKPIQHFGSVLRRYLVRQDWVCKLVL